MPIHRSRLARLTAIAGGGVLVLPGAAFARSDAVPVSQLGTAWEPAWSAVGRRQDAIRRAESRPSRPATRRS